jgi:hypothetical protein
VSHDQLDDQATGVHDLARPTPPQPPEPAASPDDDVTTFDSDATALPAGGAPTPPHAVDDEATRFVPADARPARPAIGRRVAAPTATPPPAPTDTSRPRAGGADGKSGPLAVGEPFGTRYQIIRVLGVGGMGAVYEAWDAELGVSVAVKVIRPEIAADPAAAAEIERRFKRELLLARQVTHPNIIRIHDLGDIGGIKYITMPFIEGADLATILKNETKLPLARALRIARGTVAGLVSAHQAGVVHRDLKPANIMIGPDDVPRSWTSGSHAPPAVPRRGRRPRLSPAFVPPI